MIVNFDNAATTYPKPAGVRQAVERAVLTCGSAGRGGHPLAARSSAVVCLGSTRNSVIFCCIFMFWNVYTANIVVSF